MAFRHLILDHPLIVLFSTLEPKLEEETYLQPIYTELHKTRHTVFRIQNSQMANTFVSSLNATGDSVGPRPAPMDPFVPGSANLFPKMVNRIDEAAWELWQFDGFSADNETAVSISFYRDTRGFKEGGFHVELNALWPDGSKWGEKLYFVESTITADNGSVHGIWKSSDSTATVNNSVSFDIAADLSTATVRFSVPDRVTGTIELRALGGNRESRLPPTEGAALLGPSVYYLFPLGPAAAAVDLVLFDAADDETSGTAHKRTVIMRADDGTRGGFVRGWSTFAWPQIMTDAYYMCGTAGPYMLQVIRIVSSAADGRKPHTVARLYRDEGLVYAANQVHNNDTQPARENMSVQGEDTVVVEKVFDGDAWLAGAFRDKNTGYVIEFIQDGMRGQGKRWRFEVRHKLAWWNDYTSDQGTGKSGFLETILGGQDGEQTFTGSGVAGQLELP